jgi:hypothetical protein
MATRKSFIRIAQALRLTSASQATIVAVGLALSADNPRFNLDKFVETSSPEPVKLKIPGRM